MITKTKIYFASDLHLGVPNATASLERERFFVAWLNKIKEDASELYLLGDIFDSWFEYKQVVPRGHVRLLGKLAEIADSGIKIHYFTGNHDMWVFDYFEKEFGAIIYRAPITIKIGDKIFHIGHGDGLGSGDLGYKFIKRVFAGKLNQWLYARLHPNFAIGLANFLSRKSRMANGGYDEVYEGEDKEGLVIYCNEFIKNQHVDYFVFGHRHLPLEIKIGVSSKYINLGEWVNAKTYGVFDGTEMKLERFLNK